VRVKTDIKNIKKIPHTRPSTYAYMLSTAIFVEIRELSEQESPLKRQIICMVPI
jgi:hypothetical protein